MQRLEIVLLCVPDSGDDEEHQELRRECPDYWAMTSEGQKEYWARRDRLRDLLGKLGFKVRIKDLWGACEHGDGRQMEGVIAGDIMSLPIEAEEETFGPVLEWRNIRKRALAKLTPEEKDVLGLSKRALDDY